MNTNVKNQFQGIMKYADVSKAVKRWTVTNYTKSELVKSLLEIYSIKDPHQGIKMRKVQEKKRESKSL